jgi:dihydrofolate reductase
MKLAVIENVTLDGVIQAPGGKEEDPRGAFPHGGWAVPYADAVMAAAMQEDMGRRGSLLLGRRTYEHFFSVWPQRKDGNPFTDVLNKTTKYVASRTLKRPLPWQNSTLLEGDLAEAVTQLKKRPGPDLAVLGSGELVQTLRRHDLVDEYVLSIHPLVLGTGRRLFPDGATFGQLRLVSSKPTTTGVIIATFHPASRAER